MHDLALQIRQVHDVAVDEANGTNAGRSQVQAGWRAQAARADEQYLGTLQLELTFAADILEDDVPAVTLNFGLGEFHMFRER